MNLNANLKYKIISLSYNKIEDSMGFCCENCNRLISNIATIKDEFNNVFNVGMDCAKTLSKNGQNIDYWDILQSEYAFEEGKALRAKIQKFNKKHPDGKHYIYTNKENGNYFLCNSQNGMTKIVYPSVSIDYIKDLLS